MKKPYIVSPSKNRKKLSELSIEGLHWDYSSDVGRTFLEKISIKPLSGHLVKMNAKRRVVHSEGTYAKEVGYQGLGSFFKTIAGGTACREGRISLELARLGVPVPEVVAFGSEYRQGLLKRDLLLTREVENGIPLSIFWNKSFVALAPKDKIKIIRCFASFIYDLHDKGVLHTDLHFGNILLVHTDESWHFVLLDTDRVRLYARPLEKKDRIENLGQLLSNFWRSTSRSQRFRFLQEYGSKLNKEERTQWMKAIGRKALRASHKIWTGKAYRALHNNSRFIRETKNDFRIFRLRTTQSDSILAALLPDPDRVFETGEIIKEGKTTKVARIEIDGSNYFIKRYNCKGWIYRFRNAFRRSRAVRTWLVSWGFAVRALPVPRPLLCMEERHVRLLGRSYILTDFIEDSSSFSARWRRMNEDGQRNSLIRLAILLGTMHFFGCLHGDLKSTNIRLRRDGFIFLTDLDGSRVFRRLGKNKTRKDIGRFYFDLDRLDGSRSLTKLFQQTYERWRNK